MKLMITIIGVTLIIISIPLYVYFPQILTDNVHFFVASMTRGNTNSVSILHQMGYPSMSQVIFILKNLIIGMGIAGGGLAIFGLIAKKTPKTISLKLVSDEPLKELHIGGHLVDSRPKNAPKPDDSKQIFDSVNGVLGKLETELKDMKSGYEVHRQKIEDEKKRLEKRKREQLAKIIATGEVLIKEITAERFEERVTHYVELKNEETGEPLDLTLLAEKFSKMKQKLDSTNSNYTSDDFENIKRFLDQ